MTNQNLAWFDAYTAAVNAEDYDTATRLLESVQSQIVTKPYEGLKQSTQTLAQHGHELDAAANELEQLFNDAAAILATVE